MGFASTLEDIDERLQTHMHLLGMGTLAPPARPFPAPERPSDHKRLMQWLLSTPRDLRALAVTAATADAELHELITKIEIERDYASRVREEVLAMSVRGAPHSDTVWKSTGGTRTQNKARSMGAMLLADGAAKDLARRSKELRAVFAELQRGPDLCVRCGVRVQAQIDRARQILQEASTSGQAIATHESAGEIVELGVAMKELIDRIAEPLSGLIRTCATILDSLDLSRQELQLMASELEDARRPRASRRG